MTSSRVLFWHRRDLRLADNLGLAAATEISPAVTGVYVLDPAVINPPQELPPMAPARLWFLLESLVELQRRWREAGSRLLVVEGDPVAVLPQLAQQIGAEAVVWNRDVEPYARERDRQVAQRLQADGRRVVVDWDQLLIAPELLKTGGGEPYRVYGPFLRNWRGQVLAKQPSTVAAPTGWWISILLSCRPLSPWRLCGRAMVSRALRSAPVALEKRRRWPNSTASVMGRCSAMSLTAISPVPQAPPASVLP